MAWKEKEILFFVLSMSLYVTHLTSNKPHKLSHIIALHAYCLKRVVSRIVKMFASSTLFIDVLVTSGIQNVVTCKLPCVFWSQHQL